MYMYILYVLNVRTHRVNCHLTFVRSAHIHVGYYPGKHVHVTSVLLHEERMYVSCLLQQQKIMSEGSCNSVTHPVDIKFPCSNIIE